MWGMLSSNYWFNNDKINNSLINEIRKKSTNVRHEIVNILHQTGGGHYGGALSLVEIIVSLFETTLNINSDNVQDKYRNKFILSKGHAAIVLYIILKMYDITSKIDLESYASFYSNLEGHPDMGTPGVDFSTGSLGQGLSAGLGMAIALKPHNKQVWVVLGDGECQEGQIWEAVLFAERYKLDNIHVIVDLNGHQECGFKNYADLAQEPLIQAYSKWKAFGWHTEIINGHNIKELLKAINRLQKIKSKPSVILAQTQKGAGVELFTKDPEQYHCATLTDNEFTLVKKELNL